MRVVAVSRAQPRWVEIRGRQVFTSILHDASDGPLAFEADGPADNATAVHTEQVLAMPAQHYDHWTRELGIERGAWGWCHWGENLTLDGVDEATLCIGDRLRVGDEAVFEVTSPRIPCFKLAWRIGQPDTVLLRLIETGRIGFYLRVLQPGEVRADDKVVLEKFAGDTITVADLSRLLIDRAATADRLRRVLAIPALGAQAHGVLLRRAAQIEETAEAQIGCWDGWRDFRVARVEDEAADIRSFHLDPCDGGAVPAALPGQFVTVQTQAGVRTWSLSRHGGAYRLSIKRGSNVSDWMHRAVAPGAVLQLRAPAGRFVLSHGLLRPVLLSAGIGVTPLLAMLQAQAARGGRPLRWIHSTRNGRTHALRDEVERVLQAQPAFTRQVHYTAPLPEDRLGIDYDRAGRITADDIASLLRTPYTTTPFGRRIELSGVDSEFYICGPQDFEAMVRASLEAGGVAASQVFSETFHPHAGGADTAEESAEVRFGMVQLRWTGGSLLDLAEAAGLEPASGCRIGACHACAVKLRAGQVRYDPAPLVEAAPGTVLLCCARPASAIVEVDL
jgi:uncharacterized protein